MSLPRYPKYKKTGIDWLGEVPAHWQCMRLGAIFREVSEPGNDELPILSVSIHDGVSDKELDEGESDRKVTRSDDRSKYKAVAPGDLTYNMMRAWQGGFGTVSVHGMVSPAYVVARPKAEFATSIVEMLLRTPNAVSEMKRYSRGVTDFRLRLYWDDFKAIQIALPPTEEQKNINMFLDHEAAKSDALIAEQEKLITLLSEKRQATISHAVTKGLNPNAPMKDSGVAWLGQVPAHWKVGRAGFYVSVLPGYAFSASDFSLDESDVRLLRGINVAVGELRWDEVVYWKRQESDGLLPFELKAGDVVIGMDRPLISGGIRVASVKAEDLPCLLLQRVAKVDAGPSMDSRFILRLLSSQLFAAHFMPETTGVSVPHISGDQIANFVVPVPALDEQRQICGFLDGELQILDALNRKSERAIELLKERRSALIAAAVTGQIDVRAVANV